VAQAFRDAEPRNLDADITEEAQSVTPPRAEVEGSATSSRKKTLAADKRALAADLIAAIRTELGSPIGTSPWAVTPFEQRSWPKRSLL
jgi:hypothetical protein